MLRNVNLLSYLPPYVREYSEIDAIMQSENMTVQSIEDETEVIKNNQFITTCDDIGIGMYERMLGLVPLPDDDLRARISRVLSVWMDSIPYTYRALEQRLTSLYGAGNWEIQPNFSNYAMTVIVNAPLSGQVEALRELLKRMIPANIVVETQNVLKRTFEGNVTTGGVTFTVRTTLIKEVKEI